MPAEKMPSPEEPAPTPLPIYSSVGEQLLLPASTFIARFGAAEGITLDRCEYELLQRALYPPARWFYPVLNLIPGYFRVDTSFVHAVGRATSLAEFQAEVRHFADDSGHVGLLRGSWKLRISVRRLRRIARKLLPSGMPSASPAPVVEPSSGARPARTWNGPERRLAPVLPLPQPRPLPGNDVTVENLKQEVARLKEQRAILTKAVGIIAETSSEKRDPSAS